MKTVIPSTSLKARYIKTLPLLTYYLDPSNGFKYRVEECLVRDCLSRAGVAYFGPNDGKELKDVPNEMLKVLTPNVFVARGDFSFAELRP